MSGTTSPPIRVEGHCDSAFAVVESAFRENFRLHDEVGAGLCIHVDGKAVVDLWGGHRDAARTQPWQRDTLVNAYSVGKGITSMLVLSLVEQGELDLDERVAAYWPAFGVEGKGDTTLRMILAHRAGLPGVRKPLPEGAMLSWQTMTEALAEQAPFWEPGTAHGYHVNSFGFLVGEPIVRKLGVSFAEALHRRVTASIEADFHIGLPGSEHGRVAELIQATPPKNVNASDLIMSHFATGNAETDAMLRATYMNPTGLSGFGTVNREDWRLASIPSTNGHATARAVAALYDLFLRSDAPQGGLVGPGLRSEAIATQSEGTDKVLGKPSRFGLGFQLSQPSRRVGTESGFGHYGYGGTLGFADPETGVAFGYLMNRPGQRWQTTRTNGLLDALDEALGRPQWGEDDPQ
jgi:CubicO group peptidase (beta-lactamase class C family)